MKEKRTRFTFPLCTAGNNFVAPTNLGNTQSVAQKLHNKHLLGVYLNHVILLAQQFIVGKLVSCYHCRLQIIIIIVVIFDIWK